MIEPALGIQFQEFSIHPVWYFTNTKQALGKKKKLISSEQFVINLETLKILKFLLKPLIFAELQPIMYIFGAIRMRCGVKKINMILMKLLGL